MEAQVRFPLQVCFVHPKSLTHFFNGKEWVRGPTDGTVTRLLISALENSHDGHSLRKVLPLIPLWKLARSLGCKKPAGLMLLLTRYYAVPVVPVVTSPKKRRWFIVPCFGLFQFLREFAGINPSQIDFIFSVEILRLSETAKRVIISKMAELGLRWESIDNLVFVPLDALEEAAMHESKCRWSFKTALLKGFQALLKFRPDIELGDEEQRSALREISELAREAKIEFGADLTDLNISLLDLEFLIIKAFKDCSEEFRRSLMRLVCDGPSDLALEGWWDLENGKVNPLFAIYHEARRRLFCRIYKRAKLTEKEIREYAPYWSPKPGNLLTKALMASYRKLVDKNAEKFKKLAERGIEVVKVAVTALQDRVFHVPVPKDAFNRLVEKLKVNASEVEPFIRWTYEHFGFRGLRFILYGDRAAAVAVYNTAINFPNLSELFGKFYETIVNWADKVVFFGSRRDPFL